MTETGIVGIHGIGAEKREKQRDRGMRGLGGDGEEKGWRMEKRLRRDGEGTNRDGIR